MRFLLLALLPSLVACGTDEERFPDQVAKTWCSGLKACDVDRFWDTYWEGTPECRDSYAIVVRAQSFRGDDLVCQWLQDDAEDCMDALRTASCDEILDDDWMEACISAWDCVTVIRPGED